MNETIQQIKSIINPVRVLKAFDFMGIANVITPESERARGNEFVKSAALSLLSRYEPLTSQTLVKEMFVCGVEKPDKQDYQTRADFVDYDGFYEDLATYQAAQKKILFEGFEEMNIDNYQDWHRIRHTESGFTILFRPESIRISESTYNYKVATIKDIEYILDRYNRTASKPVIINHSDEFLNELIK